MSALRRSARGKAGQPETEHETLSAQDLREPPAPTNQHARTKAKGKGKCAAPKAKHAPDSAAPPDFRAAISDSEAEIEPSDTAKSVPRKRGHPKAQLTGEDPAAEIVGLVEKKRKVISPTALEDPRPEAKKAIPQRSPLPKRINRVVQPAKPAMPRPKRTSAEVAATKAKKAELLQRLDELDKERKIALAEMDLDEEAEDAEEERTSVRHLKDLSNTESQEPPTPPNDDVVEEFPMDDDDPSSPDDVDTKSPAPEDDEPELEHVGPKAVSAQACSRVLVRI